MKVFRNIPGDSTSIDGNNVNRIYEDNDSSLWIAHQSGLAQFNPRTEKFINYYFQDSAEGHLSTANASDIIKLGNEYYVSSAKGLRQINFSQKTIVPVPGFSLARDINGSINVITKLSEQELLLGTTEGLYIVNCKTKQLVNYRLPSSIRGKNPVNTIMTVYLDKKGIAWIGRWGDFLSSFDSRSKTFSFYEPFLQNVLDRENVNLSIVPANNDSILLISDLYHGIFFFNSRTRKLVKNIVVPGNKTINYYSCYVDRSNCIWIATSNGVFVIDPLKQLITTHLLKPGNLQSQDLKGTLFSISERKDNAASPFAWMHSYMGGIVQADLLNNKFQKEPSSLRNVFPPRYYCVVKIIDDFPLHYILTLSDGLYIFDERKNTLKHCGYANSKTNYRINGPSQDMFIDSKDRIWMATVQGVDRYDAMADTFHHYDMSNETVAPYVVKIREDSKGNIWVLRVSNSSLSSGISKIDVSTGNWINYTTPLILSHSSGSGKALSDMWIDKNDKIYLAGTSGLIRVIVNQDKAESEMLKCGSMYLPPVNTIVSENDSILWLSSNRGLYRYNTNRTAEFQLYTEEESLHSNSASCIVKNGNQLYLGYDDNVIQSIDLLMAAGKKEPPNVVLSEFLVFDKEFLPNGRQITFANNFRLNYKQNNIRFEFAALDYTNPQFQQFAYKLEGLDEDWIYTNDPLAIYNHLDAGHYVFRIKAANSFGIWNEKGIAVQFYIVPPFWKRPWFIVAVSFLLLTIVAALVRRRIKQVRGEEQLKQQRMDAELKALRAQMNPHFIFNCLNTIDSFIVTNRQDEASALLQKFSKLIRIVLENSTQEKTVIRKDWEALINYIELEETIHESTFTYTADIDEILLNDAYMIPPLLLQPYVENAILHGLRHRHDKKGELNLSMKLKGDKIIAVIEDNGIGRESAANINSQRESYKQSLGTELVRRRLESWAGKTGQAISTETTDRINNDNPEGTRVTIVFPAEKE
jgi:streptogramin lyase